jgi:probable HAF family extracellular repeat protein
VILWGDTFGGAAHAAIWDDGVVTDLGTFGGKESWAYGLNNRGYVVGWAELSLGNYHAFVYDGTSMTDLGTLGGMFSSAYGINDAGVIVGAAMTATGQWQAVAWVPAPEPVTMCLWVLGACAVFVRRRAAAPGGSGSGIGVPARVCLWRR